MPSVRRHIHIDAPPEAVRPFLDDPALRRGWLDEEVELFPGDDGSRRFSDDRGDVERHVHIRLDPEDGGSRVTITESLGDEPDDTLEPLSDNEVVALFGRPERLRHADDLQGRDDIDGTDHLQLGLEDLRPTLIAA